MEQLEFVCGAVGSGAGMTAALATAAEVVPPGVFRDAMSRLAAAVHIVTTTGEHGDAGITATAVCSVSDAPANLLVCLNRKSRAHDLILASGILAVNMLSAGQEELAALFAGQRDTEMADRFLHGRWARLATGAPVLEGCMVSFDCAVTESIEVGTHRVFFCRVLELAISENKASLVYGARRFLAFEMVP